MHLPKNNGTYQTRRILPEAEPERPLPEKNAGGYQRFVDSPTEGCRRLTQVGALPHPTLPTETLNHKNRWVETDISSFFSKSELFEYFPHRFSITKP